MALVAPDIARFTLNGDFGSAGSAWANILDVKILAAGGFDRADAVPAVAGRLADAWAANIAPNVSTSITLRSVGFVDLDSEDGVTGTYTSGGPITLPFSGTLVGNMSTRNTAYLVHKSGTPTRGSRSGRWYIPGVLETEVGEVQIAAERVTAFNSDLLSFLVDMIGPGPEPVGACDPCIVHTRNQGTPTNPDIVFVGFSPIQALTVDPEAATQRRRMRR